MNSDLATARAMRLTYITIICIVILPPLVFSACASVSGISGEVEGEVVPADGELLKSGLQTFLQRPEFDMMIPSIIVISADFGDTLFSYYSDLLVRPASNQKLFTSIAAVQLLGPSYSFRTTLYRTGEIRSGTLYGDLIIKGRGDPLFSLNDIDDMVAAVRLFGIDVIEGGIIVDESYFDDIRWPTGWMWDDEPYSFAPFVSALSVNSNVVTLRVDPPQRGNDTVTVRSVPNSSHIRYRLESDSLLPNQLLIIPEPGGEYSSYRIRGDLGSVHIPRRYTVTVQNPAMFAGRMLREKLADAGIGIRGGIARGTKESSAVPLIQVNTPIDSVLHAMNKISDNLSAETVWKVLGAELYGPPGTGIKGQKAVITTFEKFGVDVSELRLADGSGVSYYNLVTARTLAEIMSEIRKLPTLSASIYNSLSIMGIDGTLRNRAVGSPIQGKVRAKTGTLSGVSSLTGYVETQSGETLIFAMIFQNFTGSASRYRQLQDEICRQLFMFRRDNRSEPFVVGEPNPTVNEHRSSPRKHGLR
jgi:serine-type D-Ala-D-Ala carboxypeptidase/endopeptidase (penicillin-binding protein 4)